MPSAIPYLRTVEDDLDALGLYARTYKGKDWRERVKKASSAYKGLKQPFLNYGKLFQTPRRLFPAKLRGLASFLHDLYESKAEPFRYIEAMRNPERVGACPYCGLSKNITVDHYLPRTHRAFPHLSFLSLNLGPSCSDCQGSKSSFYPRKPASDLTPAMARRHKLRLKLCSEKHAAIRKARRSIAQPAPSLRLRGPTPLRPRTVSRILETRRFIHPYLDRFLRRCVFDVDLAWASGRPEIARFLWKPHLTSAQRALVAFHLEKMKVKDRARGIIRRRYRAFAKVIAGKNLNEGEIVSRLQLRLASVKEETGIANSIEAKYLEALLRDPTAIAELVTASSIPKPHPLMLVETAVPRVVKARKRRAARDFIH
ncbi:hypothetical protein CBM2609_U20003 [Cupriavidus taiwanensis]|uniref:hypothetical protein n=1 Tax=Cupriavidus taiwanensis TaxID=164546 RepID=UPI000E1B2C64|nr:hypothetical protein [Cupriavidus taiwanensis]SOZ22478.1 hypothetical protein CBM2604_U20003 [Cupriavidus taiwanensis]SOZ34503.1 hypothetical protein CBM2609_U20003 [Cupriavidus taiwanensis]SOZ53149.1 hypothetical protein CBM2610_U30009 [Cupriavidus taiwanensis]